MVDRGCRNTTNVHHVGLEDGVAKAPFELAPRAGRLVPQRAWARVRGLISKGPHNTIMRVAPFVGVFECPHTGAARTRKRCGAVRLHDAEPLRSESNGCSVRWEG